MPRRTEHTGILHKHQYERLRYFARRGWPRGVRALLGVRSSDDRSEIHEVLFNARLWTPARAERFFVDHFHGSAKDFYVATAYDARGARMPKHRARRRHTAR